MSARLQTTDRGAQLTVEDDGKGFGDEDASKLRSRGGLAGIRERIVALGGDFEMGNNRDGGARVLVVVPADTGAGQGD